MVDLRTDPHRFIPLDLVLAVEFQRQRVCDAGVVADGRGGVVGTEPSTAISALPELAASARPRPVNLQREQLRSSWSSALGVIFTVWHNSRLQQDSAQ